MLLLPGNLFLALGVGGHQPLRKDILPLNSDGAMLCHAVVQVLRDLFLALGVGEQQLLPLEVESLNCGGNARCSMELTRKLGLTPKKVIMIQVWMCARMVACV